MLSQEEFNRLVTEVCKFHTKKAPGLALGVGMVDYALELLGPVKGKLNAITEAQACLSDVIQVMLGCTIGNRYLRVMGDIGRYAITLFDREDGRGIRVFLDPRKVDPKETPELHKFIHRTRDPSVQAGGPDREKSGEKILFEFEKVGRKVFGFQRVKVRNHAKPPMLPAKICPNCGESFLCRDGKHIVCDVCTNAKSYYDIDDQK